MVDEDRLDLVVAEHFSAAEEGEFDQKGHSGDLRAELVEQLERRARGAAGGEEVVHQQDGLARSDGVLVEFHDRLTVFQ